MVRRAWPQAGAGKGSPSSQGRWGLQWAAERNVPSHLLQRLGPELPGCSASSTPFPQEPQEGRPSPRCPRALKRQPAPARTSSWLCLPGTANSMATMAGPEEATELVGRDWRNPCCSGLGAPCGMGPSCKLWVQGPLEAVNYGRQGGAACESWRLFVGEDSTSTWLTLLPCPEAVHRPVFTFTLTPAVICQTLCVNHRMAASGNAKGGKVFRGRSFRVMSEGGRFLRRRKRYRTPSCAQSAPAGLSLAPWVASDTWCQSLPRGGGPAGSTASLNDPLAASPPSQGQGFSPHQGRTSLEHRDWSPKRPNASGNACSNR